MLAHTIFATCSGKAHENGDPASPYYDPQYHVTVSGCDTHGDRLWTVHIYPDEDFEALARSINRDITREANRRIRLNAAAHRGAR